MEDEGSTNTIRLPKEWKNILQKEFQKPYFQQIRSFLLSEINSGKVIYPPGKLIFNAFEQTEWRDLKVVIIGQDPYHGPGQAMGLSFSVPKEIGRIPPSLKNIFKELETDLHISVSSHGDLRHWANQGVFLLNAILTVEHKKPRSHKNIGWETFTNAVIQHISDHKEGIVFLLWGNFAKGKRKLINETKHYVFTAPHPSPLARGGFFGCRHFSKTNEILLSQGHMPIDWKLPQSDA